MLHSQACIFHENSFKILRTLSLNKIKCDFLKIGCLVLSAFLLGSTMGDKFALQEPFVGHAAEAICSLLWKRHLMLHLSPPAAGYNSTHLEPLSRGAEQSSCIIILHNNGCSGKQETNIEYIPERLSWGTEVKGPEGGLQGGKAEGRKVSEKLNKVVHQTRPFSCSVRWMLLPHLATLDVIVLQRVPELPAWTWASSVAVLGSTGRGIPCVLPRGPRMPPWPIPTSCRGGEVIELSQMPRWQA